MESVGEDTVDWMCGGEMDTDIFAFAFVLLGLLAQRVSLVNSYTRSSPETRVIVKHLVALIGRGIIEPSQYRRGPSTLSIWP